MDALAGMIDGRVKLIAITHIPTNGGLVNPAAAVGRVARAPGIPYLLDACQTAGQMPIDVDEIGCDMLSATGRKFLRAPRGTGFLYCARSMLEQLEPPFLDIHAATWVAPGTYEIHADGRRFENWETNFAAKIGLGVAVSAGLDGLDAIEDRVTGLGESLRRRRTTCRAYRPRPGRSPVRHRHLHRRPPDPHGIGDSSRTGDQRLGDQGRRPAWDIERPGPDRNGPGIRPLLQHSRRARPDVRGAAEGRSARLTPGTVRRSRASP